MGALFQLPCICSYFCICFAIPITVSGWLPYPNVAVISTSSTAVIAFNNGFNSGRRNYLKRGGTTIANDPTQTLMMMRQYKEQRAPT